MNNKEREIEQFRAGKLQEYIKLAEEEAKNYTPVAYRAPVYEIPENYKQCIACGKKLPLWEFPKWEKFEDGYGDKCRNCMRIHRRMYKFKKDKI